MSRTPAKASKRSRTMVASSLWKVIRAKKPSSWRNSGP